MHKKLVSTPCHLNSAMGVTYSVQLLVMPSSACTPSAGLGSIQSALLMYVFYNNHRVMFEATICNEQGYSLHLQRA